jgi:glycosyltransferase involved in cell wall biosynthesis
VTESLRVLVLIDSLMSGGAELLVTDFVRGARGVGITPAVAYLGERDGSPAADRLRERGIEPVCVQIGGLVHPRSLARVRSHVRGVAPDIVHTHLAYADLMGGLAARSLGIPYVSTIHVTDWEAHAPRDQVRRRLIAAVRRRLAAEVVTVSDAARVALLRAGLDRPGHVRTIHNGVAAEPAPGAGPRIRAELGIGSDEIVIAQVSVLRPGKGHRVAAEAVAKLRERHPGLRLVVVGDGPARADAERALEPLGGAAVLLGHRTDVMEVLDAADVLVHPSEADAFPTAVIEAMAASLPVVATRVGGIPEIVMDGDTGALVPAPARATELAGALEPLVTDASLRARMGSAGRARYEREFTVETWARRTRALYDVVLERRSGA